MKRIEGAYSIVVMLKDKLIAVRDPHGIRPLVMGNIENGTIFASENAAILRYLAAHLQEMLPLVRL